MAWVSLVYGRLVYSFFLGMCQPRGLSGCCDYIQIGFSRIRVDKILLFLLNDGLRGKDK